MGSYKILFTNIGYARGISGKLTEHLQFAHRHFFCSEAVQKKSLQQLNEIIVTENPDLCCLVEIDQGSFGSAKFNQLEMLLNEQYAYSDIENKYGPSSRLRSFALTAGKSNAFISRKKYPFEKIMFKAGVKRLIYKIMLNEKLTLFFAHFSLNKNLRAQQLLEARELMKGVSGEVIFLGDFNILAGFQEITPLLDGGHFVLLNRAEDHTFTFHKQKLVLDLCICSQGVGRSGNLRVIPQPYSDHAALLLELNDFSA